jgi:hypothetical protein
MKAKKIVFRAAIAIGARARDCGTLWRTLDTFLTRDSGAHEYSIKKCQPK